VIDSEAVQTRRPFRASTRALYACRQAWQPDPGSTRTDHRIDRSPARTQPCPSTIKKAPSGRAATEVGLSSRVR